MSKNLKQIAEDRGNDPLLPTAFFGGTERGSCIQISQRADGDRFFDSVQVTKQQAGELITRLQEWLDGTAEECHDS
jgi:hypothetical protein